MSEDLNCITPSGLKVSVINTSTATLEWTPVAGATGYNIQYRVVGTMQWTVSATITSCYTASGLTAGVNYEVQAQTICSETSASPFSNSLPFAIANADAGGGRIAGITRPDNTFAGRIAGNSNLGMTGEGKIPGDKPGDNSLSVSDSRRKPLIEKVASTRKQRISRAIDDKGLKTLPINFGDSDGDWQIIESDDLFEVLYLDQEKIISIDPGMVKNNFTLLESFWKEKRDLWESGSGQIRKAIEDKYGAKNLANSIKKLGYAFEQLFTLEKINEYYFRLKQQRLAQGEAKLEPFLKFMMKDGEADTNEIEGIIEEGVKHNLNTEEVAAIIKKTIDSKAFKPYGNPSGTLLSEQLLSVSWVTEENFRKKKEREEEIKRNGREIFDNIYAFSVEEIGQIIFDHEREAKRDIKDNLLKESVAYFSPAKARQFLDIVNAQKNEHLQYLQIAYRLKPGLPYRFSPSQLAGSPKDLCKMMFETPESFKIGKEQFRNGYPEVWFMETNKEAYTKLVEIRDKAENPDTAFIVFLYTFNPELPYRFDDMQLVKNEQEICNEITKNNKAWEAGKKELFNSTIPAWLSVAKQSPIPSKWNQVKDGFKDKKDLGLEYFLHLLDDKLDHSKLVADKKNISYAKIQSGQIIKTDIFFSNETRGYLEAYLKLSKNIPGVSLSAENFTINNIAGTAHNRVSLMIDSNVLLKGVTYATDIQATTFEQQTINIPVTFKIVFPKNAFVLEIAKYAVLFSAFLIFIRFILSSTHNGWLKADYNYFINLDQAFIYHSEFSLFGWTFFLFIFCLGIGFYFLIKYLFKHGNK